MIIKQIPGILSIIIKMSIIITIARIACTCKKDGPAKRRIDVVSSFTSLLTIAHLSVRSS